MIDKKKLIKSLVSLILYWFILIIVPGYMMFTYKYLKNFDLSGYIAFFILFIVPFLFIVPYKFSKIENRNWKFVYILFGVILPYILIYFYLYLSFKRDFHPEIL